MTDPYPRDFYGYGPNPPDPRWPGGARLALEFAINFEAGGERNILHGDDRAEDLLADVFVAEPVLGTRNVYVESTFEYGPRVGLWRLMRMFQERGIDKVTVLAIGAAAERNPKGLKALVDAGYEIVSHGWRWIDYQHVSEHTEREHIRLAVEAIEKVAGSRPLGWFTGRPSPNTRRLVVEEGGFLYDRDALNDELPYWVNVEGKPHLVIPYYYDTNDNAFGRPGFTTGEDFFIYLRDAFDVFYGEGATAPKMMTVALHDRIVGRPARAAGFARFLDHVQKHDDVWICTGLDIARHWMEHHPHQG